MGFAKEELLRRSLVECEFCGSEEETAATPCDRCGDSVIMCPSCKDERDGMCGYCDHMMNKED